MTNQAQGETEALTEPQRRHLTELLAIEREKGTAFWRPCGSGEDRSARTLERRGLLRSHWIPHSAPQYELTAAGREAVLA